MKPMGLYSIALVCLLTAGCASSIAMRISSSGAGLNPSTRFAILKAEPDGAPADATLDDMLKTNLAKSGYILASDGDYVVSSAFGIRPGNIAVFGASSLPPLSSIQEKSGLSKCKAHVHRLTISVLERATGESVYQGTAEETHCNTLAAYSLPQLVEALTNDLLKPGGARVLKRKK
jgi:hypothetical protein